MNQADWISLLILSAIIGGLWLIGGLALVRCWQKRKTRLSDLKRDERGKKLYLEKD